MLLGHVALVALAARARVGLDVPAEEETRSRDDGVDVGDIAAVNVSKRKATINNRTIHIRKCFGNISYRS